MAVERYEDFIDGHWVANERITCSPENVSKDDRGVLRLAAVLHVLYDQLMNFLQGDPKSPPP